MKALKLQISLQIVTSLLQPLSCQNYYAFQVHLVPSEKYWGNFSVPVAPWLLPWARAFRLNSLSLTVMAYNHCSDYFSLTKLHTDPKWGVGDLCSKTSLREFVKHWMLRRAALRAGASASSSWMEMCRPCVRWRFNVWTRGREIRKCIFKDHKRQEDISSVCSWWWVQVICCGQFDRTEPSCVSSLLIMEHLLKVCCTHHSGGKGTWLQQPCQGWILPGSSSL